QSNRGAVYSKMNGGFSVDFPINSEATLMPVSDHYYFIPAFYKRQIGEADQSNFDFIAVAIDSDIKDLTILGKPQSLPNSNTEDDSIKVLVNIINPTGQVLSIKWQIRR